MSLDVDLLRSSFELVLSKDPQITARFYGIFFERYPQVKSLFGRHSAQAQQDMLANVLVAALDNIEDAGWLQQNLHALGYRHEGYKVTEEMYPWVGECLIAAMAEAAGEAWTEEMTAQWAAAYGVMTELAIQGHLAARAEA
ncbi:MAG: flavohemoprotein [Alphaproteobacteria bacterium]|nr:flavohemoprotein [Alphaproteobacteria bacterium]MCB9792986.1 flavohemoprotein [Alphaproteobacteria bacterium]